MNYRCTFLLTPIFCLAASCFLFSQTVVGTWNLTEGKYNNVPIADLTGKMIITNVNADDSLNYLATFDNGSNSGTARARYTIQNNKFKSNLTSANFLLNGISSSYTIGPNGIEYIWKTSLSIANTAFNQWGGTAIGYNDPTFAISGNGNLLTFTSANGSAVLKYEREIVTGVSDLPQNEDNYFTFLENYPNPCVNATNFTFNILKGAFVNLSVFDLSGNELSVIIHNFLQPDEYTYQWQPGDIPSGIYFYRLVVEDQLKNGMLIIQK